MIGKKGSTIIGIGLHSEDRRLINVNDYFKAIGCDVRVEGNGKSKFQTLVDKYQSQYTNFTVDGISLKLPYFISNNGVYGGKNSPEEIQEAIKRKFYINGQWTATQSQIQSYINSANANEKRNYGIDCSGFVYYVLNESTKANSNANMTTGALYSQYNATYGNGVSASSLTSTNNGIQINSAKDIVIGATIRTDNGGMSSLFTI